MTWIGHLSLNRFHLHTTETRLKYRQVGNKLFPFPCKLYHGEYGRSSVAPEKVIFFRFKCAKCSWNVLKMCKMYGGIKQIQNHWVFFDEFDSFSENSVRLAKHVDFDRFSIVWFVVVIDFERNRKSSGYFLKNMIQNAMFWSWK